MNVSEWQYAYTAFICYIHYTEYTCGFFIQATRTYTDTLLQTNINEDITYPERLQIPTPIKAVQPIQPSPLLT